MYVESIKLINFRNYKNLNIKLNKKLNIFLGHNAQGKTNLLESIYIASNGRSYRTSRDKELINIDKNQGYIGLVVEKNNFNKHIEIKFEKDKNKRIKINKIEVEKISELIGQVNTVIFSPEDLELIKGGPSNRRSFLDIEISQIKPRYRYYIGKYNKILFQRNNLLKKLRYNKKGLDTIDIWDTQLIDAGVEIIFERIGFIKKLSSISKDIHKNLTTTDEELGISYLPSIYINLDTINKEDIRHNFKKLLNDNLEKDIEKGTTEYGPHKDDLDVSINGLTCKIYGSQGQQRTAALSLKLAEVELINLEIGEYPILLLDDVLSELDMKRRKALVSTFKDIQTIITSTDDIDIEDIEKCNKSKFFISDGSVLYKGD